MAIRTDIIVLGSGFGGSLLSLLLAKSGRSVVMLDRSRHPRFAIGESSTPLADATLRQLAQEFDIPELHTLSRYGTWKKTHPGLRCGLKRGFSYFGHTADGTLRDSDQLLVAASHTDQHADTHWMRSDVDAFCFELAQRNGVTTFEEADVELHAVDGEWRVTGLSTEQSLDVAAPFAVDATGGRSAILQTLNISDQTHILKTFSRAVFAHFSGVRSVADMLDELHIDRRRHPFACDSAAVHHLLNEGWMWQLRFDDDSVSTGFAYDPRGPAQAIAQTSAQDTWTAMLNRSSFLRTQFQNARIIRPAQGLQHTARLQRLACAAAGGNWAALPNTVGFIDPLHSTGIAHTLSGVRRLSQILTGHRSAEQQTAALRHYSVQLIDEIRFVDQLVEGCYAALPDFRLFAAWSMLYFAAVTSMEQQSATAAEGDAFLRTDDQALRACVTAARRELQSVIATGRSHAACDQFENWLRTELHPWNHVGLLDPAAHGMYSQTAAP